MYFPVSAKRSNNSQMLVKATTVLLFLSLFLLCNATPNTSRSSGPRELVAKDAHRHEDLHPDLLTRNEDDDDCEDDCTNVNGFDDDELEKEERDERRDQDVEDEPWSEIDDADDQGPNEKRDLEKRAGTKWITACKGKAKMRQGTGSYPGPKNLVKRRGKENIRFFDFKDRANCDSFAFGVINGQTRRNTDGLASEHILEVHLVQDFIDKTDKGGGKYTNPDPKATAETDLCYSMQPYWQMRPRNSRVSQANGVTSPVEKQPLKWIAEQFPNSPDTFIDELPLLDQDVNTMKERAWQGIALVDEKKAKTSMKVLIASDNYDKDLQKAIKKYKNGLAVKKYHRDKQVQKILLKQTRRIGDMFRSLDEDVLPNKQLEGKSPYKPLKLAEKWLTFMDERTDAVIGVVEDWLKTWEKEFSKRRDQLRKEKKDENAKQKPNQKKIQTLDRFIERIALLSGDYKAQQKKIWQNPFKIDPDGQMSTDEDE